MSIDTAADANFGGSKEPESGRNIPRWFWAVLALVMIIGITALATAAGPKFSFKKNFCAGNPMMLSKPADCTLATPVPMNTPVYYTFAVTNPWSQPQQDVDIIDTKLSNPSSFGFTPSGPIFCRDDLGASVFPFASTATNGIVKITLGVGRTVTCFAPGIFTSSGTKLNKAEGNSPTHNAKDDVTTEVLGTTPINADLSVTKMASPNAVNLTTGNGNITYTITVKNNGPADVDVGNWFVLHDRFSLLPNSVPLNVEFVSANCSVTPASGSTPNDCLDPNDINLTGGTPTLVGTMGYHNFFDWKYPAGSNGHLQSGSTMTLTIKVRILQLGGLNCIQVKDANGLRNETFFTLANATSAKTELNPANNTAAVNAAVETGQTKVDPNCGTGHLKMTKEQVDPSNPVPWNSKVTYKIVIENASIPAQQITIAKNDLQDWVQEGVNTPPFTRIHVDTVCEPSETTISAGCSDFTPGISADPDHSYTFYGEVDHAWDTTEKIEMQPGEKITFYTTFVYAEPDCETVPNANPKPIINIARATYKASPYGAITVTGQTTTFTQQAKAITEMEPQPACEFLVKKTLKNNPAVVEFGVPLDYRVSFTNLGPARNIGTVIDVARISIPDYATSLPFTSTWKCQASWSGGPSANGVINGTAVHTSSPAQGSPTINLGSNIAFPSGGTIDCKISIVIKRPPLNDKYCTTKPALFENLALMDVTHPFNSNIAWPPSGNYTLGAGSNPKPQDKNWATVEAALPKCWDANINKSGVVGGLPSGSSPWTYFGNTNPITYTITTTNTAQSALTGPATPGFVVKDGFAAPYSNTMVASGSCASSWCWTAPVPHNVKWQIGIKNLGVGASGIWNLTLPGSAIKQGQDVNNRACVEAQGAEAGPGWYNNSGINPKCTDYNVPVIPVTTISVRKQVIDQTGAGITALGQFKLEVSCTPYGIPTASPSTSLHTTNPNGYSNYFTVNTVPMSGTCKVAETAMPAIPAAMAQRCGGVGNVAVSSNAPITLGALSATGNQVTVTNTYRCTKGPILTVTKRISNPAGSVVLTNLNFSVTANCTPGGSATQPVNNGLAVGTITFPVQLNASCTVTENSPLPAFPASAKTFCGPGNKPEWNTPLIAPSNGKVPIGANGAQVSITNSWKCVPVTGQLEVIKSFTTLQTAVQWPATIWTINTNCTPSGASSTVTINTPASGNAVITGSGMVTAPIADNCTVTEPTPTIAFSNAIKNYCSLPANGGGIPAWDAPTYTVNGVTTSTPPSVTITNGVQTVTVNNAWHCLPNTGTLAVKKIFKTQIPPGPTYQWTSENWTVNTNCSPNSTPTALTLTTGTGYNWLTADGSVIAPLNAVCTVTEDTTNFPTVFPPFATNYCTGGTTPEWDAPTYTYNGQTSSTPPSVTITSAGQTVTVTNTWSCKSNNGQIDLIKIVQGPTAQLPNMTFTINATCTPAASVSTAAITTSYPHSGTNGGPIVAPVGANCTLSEVQPLPVDPAMTAFCPANTTATWQTWPPVSLTITAAPQTVRVINIWSCVPNNPNATDQLEVIKNVQGPAIPTQFPQTIFNIGVICNPVASTPGLPITTLASSNAAFGNSDMFTTPENANCVVNETVPAIPAAAVSHCQATAGASYTAIWEAPTYSSPSVNMGPGIQTVTVTNKWKCVLNHPWFLAAIKKVEGPAGAPPLPALPYVISRNCTGTMSSGALLTGSVTINTATTSGTINVGGFVPVGGHCMLSEVQPALPAAAQTYCDTATPGSIATWNAPTYSLPMPVAGDFPTNNKTVTVTNSWLCLSNQKVAPKKKKKSKFKFNIGIGIGGGGGGGGDKPKQPRDPQPR